MLELALLPETTEMQIDSTRMTQMRLISSQLSFRIAILTIDHM